MIIILSCYVTLSDSWKLRILHLSRSAVERNTSNDGIESYVDAMSAVWFCDHAGQ